MANKTTKYEMYVNTGNTSGLVIPISRREFRRQIMYYEKMISKNHEEYKKEIEELKEDNPNYWMYSYIEGCLDDISIETEDFEKYTIKSYAVFDRGTAIVFRELACKEGYHWKK